MKKYPGILTKEDFLWAIAEHGGKCVRLRTIVDSIAEKNGCKVCLGGGFMAAIADWAENGDVVIEPKMEFREIWRPINYYSLPEAN